MSILKIAEELLEIEKVASPPSDLSLPSPGWWENISGREEKRVVFVAVVLLNGCA
jgi:hypothetical protein